VNAGLRVLSAGPGVTLQDAGRRGLLRFGVTPAGPMDEGAYAAASAAAGAVAAIEISLGGVELTAEGSTVGVALAGGAFDIRRDGAALPAACVLALEPGARLSIRAGAGGAFAYLAPFARFDLPPVLGSLATHLRSRLGPLNGRGLQAGDFLPLADLTAPPAQPLRLLAPWLVRSPAPLRALPGPQDDYFSPETLELFFSAEWRLSPRCDRMAFRLDGPKLTHAKGHDIVSDGIARGAVQVPGDGAPLVLMADRQPTGGYPKIAHVISADIDALAQLRAGAALRFTRVAHAEAVAARAERARQLAAGMAFSPTVRNDFDFAFLSSVNLVDGFIAARDEKV
jgi:5-oxoprolinase (ATP-hydrolysing) subunit C